MENIRNIIFTFIQTIDDKFSFSGMDFSYRLNLFFKFIQWGLLISFVYGIILILYSLYLFITKKPNAKKKFHKGILWTVVSIIILYIFAIATTCCILI